MAFGARAFLEAYAIPHRDRGPNCQEGWVNICCPLCGDGNYHGGFNEFSGYYHCWRCGGHRVPWVVSQLLRVSVPKAADIVRDYEDEEREQIQVEEIRKIPFDMPGEPLESGDRYHKYLSGRGFDSEEIEAKYGVLGTGSFGSLSFRLVIPIFYRGVAVSWQGRTIFPDVEPRYKNCPKAQERMPSGDLLYNLDRCRTRTAVIVEGVFDVWRIGDGCCATFGTSVTKAQVLLMAERFDEVTIVFDPEVQAKEKADRIAADLAMLGVMSNVVTIDSEDPGELGPEEVQRLRHLAGI